MIEVKDYRDAKGNRPYDKWFVNLNREASIKVSKAVSQLQNGNFSNSKSVGGGVYECRINFGPGYRIYYGKVGGLLVILLAGGTKKRQDKDIAEAKRRWNDFKVRNRKGGA